ncbi:MAG TPA: molybdenum cofactor biosynthesis protein MoaE [Lacipirellulaceae bacterium]|nr:molybdenum cofactor biosynthesis protein MoaE [Lacipirellulaceae bacterium]
MIELTDGPIDVTPLVAQAMQPAAGAVLVFLGISRQFTHGRETIELAYEAYHEMAQRELEKLEQAARDRWPLAACAIVHRLGLVPVGQASVAVVVSSAHRAAAFDAGRWLIDELKRTAPIWKQERWADGSTEWVHPS